MIKQLLSAVNALVELDETNQQLNAYNSVDSKPVSDFIVEFVPEAE